MSLVDNKLKVFQNFLLEYKSLTNLLGLTDGWIQFRLISYEQMNGSAYSGEDIDRDFWKEWIAYFGDGSDVVTGKENTDHETGFKLFLEYYTSSIQSDELIDIDIAVYNQIINEDYTIFLPQQNLLANYVMQNGELIDKTGGTGQTLFYPILDSDSLITGYSETGDNKAYNQYLFNSDAGTQNAVRLVDVSVNTDFTYDYSVAGADVTSKSGITLSSQISIEIDSGDYVTNVKLDGVLVKTDVTINSWTGTGIVNAYIFGNYITIPEEDIETMTFNGSDVFGAEVNTFLGGNVIAPYCRIAFTEISGAGNDVFDRTDVAIWDATNKVFKDTLLDVSANPRTWNVDQLLRGNEFLSSNNVIGWLLYVKAKNGGCAQIIAYSETSNTENPDRTKILKAIKDEDSDAIDYAIYTNEHSAKLTNATTQNKIGAKVSKILSISSDINLSNTTEAEQGTMDTEGYITLPAGGFYTISGTNNLNELTIDENTISLSTTDILAYADLGSHGNKFKEIKMLYFETTTLQTTLQCSL